MDASHTLGHAALVAMNQAIGLPKDSLTTQNNVILLFVDAFLV
mgnify:CR=1 FL=1